MAILKKGYFPRFKTEERRELEIGLIIARAKSGQRSGRERERERDELTTGLWKVFYRGSPNLTKITAASRLPPEPEFEAEQSTF
jgi:hypothetical protein